MLLHATGEQEKYRIVGIDEADADRGHISWCSPLARALLSHRAGDTIRFRAPGGPEDLQIVSVAYDERNDESGLSKSIMG